MEIDASASRYHIPPTYGSRGRWTIEGSPQWIAVNGVAFRLTRHNPAQCRSDFLNFLTALGISHTFSFPAFGGKAIPNAPFEGMFLGPSPADFIPLLEHHRKLVLAGETNEGFHRLLNWVALYYLPEVAELQFTLLDAASQRLGTMNLHVYDLMKLYDYVIQPQEARFPLYSDWPIRFPAQQPQGCSVQIRTDTAITYSIPFSWDIVPMSAHKHRIYHSDDFAKQVSQCWKELEELLEQWMTTEDRHSLEKLHSAVQRADQQFIPYFPLQRECWGFLGVLDCARGILENNMVTVTEYKRRHEQEFFGSEWGRKRRCEEIE